MVCGWRGGLAGKSVCRVVKMLAAAASSFKRCYSNHMHHAHVCVCLPVVCVHVDAMLRVCFCPPPSAGCSCRPGLLQRSST